MNRTHPLTLLFRAFPRWMTHSILLASSSVLAAVDNYSTAPGQGAADGMDDVWQAIYNGWGLSPTGDLDNDGCSNLVEAVAGTDPRNAADCHRVGNVAMVGTEVVFYFEAEAGKKYRVLSSSGLGGTFTTVENLSTINNVVQSPGVQQYIPAVDGAGYSLSVTKAGASKFYKLEVSDADSDGDGLSDWEEREAGLNPYLADSNADGVSDLDEVLPETQVTDTVTIAATEAIATEDGPQSGSFRIKRNRSLLGATITYALSGTATINTDYTYSPSTTIAMNPGEKEASIYITPTTGDGLEGSESVTATLTSALVAGPYSQPTIDPDKGEATVIIQNSSEATGTGLLAQYYDHAAATNYAHAANFGDLATYAYTQTNSTSGSILVTPTTNATATLAVISTGTVVRLTFLGGNLNNATYNHINYIVTAKTGSNFTVAITGTALPASSSSTCNFSLQSVLHPPVIERIDPVVNNAWIYGTPNDANVLPNNPVDNYSTVYEGYLNPTAAGNYQFQLDADDKARVLLDVDLNGTFDLPGEEIVEHGWDGATTPETIGTFKQSAAIALAVPASAAQRYKIRVEHVESTGDARCRLQWREGSSGFVNIPQANVFTHTQAVTYASSSGTVTVTTPSAHGLSAGASVNLWFTGGTLFSQSATYHGTYTIGTVPSTTTFTVPVPGAPTQSAGAAALLVNSASTTTGWLGQVFTNTTFTFPPGYLAVVGAGATNANNGIWGSGTPSPALIGKDTFSIRWTGQVQPQFTEDYTFVVQADDGCALWLNGQLQELKTAPSTISGIATYDYNNSTGDAVVSYPTGSVKPGSFIVGETVRVDPTSGNLIHGNGSTYTYDGTTGVLTVNYSNLTNIIPGGFTVGETIELDPTSGTLNSLSTLPYIIASEPSNSTFTVNIGTGIFDSDLGGTSTINILDTRNGIISKLSAVATYSYTSTTGTTVVTYSGIPGIAANAFNVGMIVELDPTTVTAGTLNTLSAASYTITAATATTFTVTLPTGLTNSTGNINISSTPGGVITPALANAFTIGFGTGKYNTGTGNISLEIVNKPQKDWSSMGNERYVRFSAVGGTRYDIRLETYDNTGAATAILSWYSPNQPKQVIPTERLYPASAPQAPPAHVSSTDAVAVVGGVFSYDVKGTNGATVTISGNPPWLTYSNGVLSGTPPPGSGGTYQVLITVTSAAGTSTSVVNLDVEEAAGNVTRELWTGVSGSSVSDIPTSTAPTSTSTLTALTGPSGVGPDYGARIRGYITAPVTGNYYFWVAAGGSAELWISNDDETVNAFKRASVATGSATPQTWSAESSQKSPWLALEAGHRYYFEVLHKAGAGTGDNLAIGWSKPGQAITAPSEVVPGYVLTPYVAPAAGSTPGTLYVATMLAQAPAISNGVGVATMRLNDTETIAYVKYDHAAFMTAPYNGMSGPITQWHVHADPYLTNPSAIIFDGDQPTNPGDGLITNPSDPNYGSYKWTLAPVGGLTLQNIRELIKQGKSYINLHTTLYGNGEIRGNFTLSNGTRTFTPPPAPPSWTDDHTTNSGAARFLTQATFGPSLTDIAALKAMASYEAWIDDQFTKPTSYQLPEVYRTENASAQGGAFAEELSFNAWWWRSITGADQLRQRVAFALSEIHVVSGQGPLDNNAIALTYFYDKLAEGAFGNFRDILETTTLTPTMGRYLDMLRNDKPDQTVGRIPNENYAREIKQLFSIGLYRMWPDGSLMLTSKDAPIDTYTQREIIGFAHVFTGWDYGYDGAFRTSIGAAGDWDRQMREVPVRHFTGPKRLLNNEVLPGIATLGGQPLDPYGTHTANLYNQSVYEQLPAQELDAAHDILFNHPNVGPFICRQLIQRLVTSNPSRDYLYRVVQKFNDNGSGVRGDMKAVIKAILLDYEARSSTEAVKPAFGKQREPLLRVTAAGRAFRADPWTGTYSQIATGTTPRTITVTTSTPHRLANGNNVLLDFTSGSPAPWTGTYSVSNVSTNTFTVQAAGWSTATYSIPPNSTVCTVTLNGHWLEAGNKAYFDFLTNSTGTLPADGIYTAITSTSTNTASGTTFTITVTPEATASNRTGNVMFPRFPPGSFTTSASGLAAPFDRRVTMDTNVNHELNVGDQVQLNFYNGSNNGTNPQPLDLVATVESVVDFNTYTFLTASAGNNLNTNYGNDAVYQFPLKSLPLARSGNVGNRPSTFAMNNTTADLEQSPIYSPTVFNYFLPDFKMPGTLASQGITTPEFQSTAETTVVRQANYLYNGVFGSGNTNGISSFNNGSGAIVMDLEKWMAVANTAVGSVGEVLGAGPAPTEAWTSNNNLPTLIDRMNTVLLSENMATGAKSAILKFLDLRPITAISLGNPCTITVANHAFGGLSGLGHNLNTGDTVTISGVTGGTFSTAINGTFTITKVTDNTFTVPTNCTVVPTSITAAVAPIIPYNNTTPTSTNQRDRLRAILHFILTSPDFAIQR